ncbi:uncharacterized protein PITG_11435 [Phytophthora infestans T30-4]|uniref:Uncharacterized protein n=2 Tax=Phytophthora infestans TaxID=4787 RepID=D0NIS2_PHYIT|nr:uncharacterized protein PITG_11435 [Phytophthora infestans T30-4]EEY59406.1 hypothetical protein PITG_11435 [Phytophthora infestans T30-4]KAF4039620.1 hypothetical protein GN244_ATG08143 [Phytophthora infestans]KAF4138638.1 hypothetical protein GN958_ATG12143 [Phytophthora infestans]|eukprot:XP_002901016.1 hypothetical protein PITG_11435 [Phytophthora infestans T30-4]
MPPLGSDRLDGAAKLSSATRMINNADSEVEPETASTKVACFSVAIHPKHWTLCGQQSPGGDQLQQQSSGVIAIPCRRPGHSCGLHSSTVQW